MPADGEIRQNPQTGQLEAWDSQSRWTPFDGQWVPVELTPEWEAYFAWTGPPMRIKGAGENIEFQYLGEDDRPAWFPASQIQDMGALLIEVGPAPEGWLGDWPPLYADGTINWTQTRSAVTQRDATPEQRVLSLDQQIAQAVQAGDMETARRLAQTKGQLSGIANPQQPRQPSIEDVMGQALITGNRGKAQALFDFVNQPTPAQRVHLMAQYADDPAALRLVFQALGMGDPTPRPQPLQGQRFDPKTGGFEPFTVGSALTPEEATRQAMVMAAQQARGTDTGMPPMDEGFPGMQTPDESFAAAIGGEFGPIPLPQFGQQPQQAQPQRFAPMMGEVTLGTPENNIPLQTALQRFQASQDVGTGQPVDKFAVAREALADPRQRLTVAGQHRFVNPETGEIRTTTDPNYAEFESFDAQGNAFRPHAGFQLESFIPPQQQGPSPEEQRFQAFRQEAQTLAKAQRPKRFFTPQVSGVR